MFIFRFLPSLFDEFGLIQANAGNRECYILQGRQFIEENPSLTAGN